MNSLELITRSVEDKKPTNMKIKDVARLMGRRVLVTSFYYKTETPDSRTWSTMPVHKPRSGWIVGTTWLQTGRWVRYRSTIYEPGESYFQENGPRKQCLLVCYWPNRKPVRVPLDGFELQAEDDEPKPHNDAYRWSDRDKEMLRQEMKDQPRDSKGRFVPLYPDQAKLF